MSNSFPGRSDLPNPSPALPLGGVERHLANHFVISATLRGSAPTIYVCRQKSTNRQVALVELTGSASKSGQLKEGATDEKPSVVTSGLVVAESLVEFEGH